MRSLLRMMALAGYGIDDRTAGPGGQAVQVAALPFKLGPTGEPDFLLITSRSTRRWIIPKGWPIRGLTLAESAAREAYEEAGVRGAIGEVELGRLTAARKPAGRSPAAAWAILVYPLLVRTSLPRWPEQGQRRRRWASRGEAADAVGDDDLERIILTFRPSRPANELMPSERGDNCPAADEADPASSP